MDHTTVPHHCVAFEFYGIFGPANSEEMHSSNVSIYHITKRIYSLYRGYFLSANSINQNSTLTENRLHISILYDLWTKDTLCWKSFLLGCFLVLKTHFEFVQKKFNNNKKHWEKYIVCWMRCHYICNVECAVIRYAKTNILPFSGMFW